MATREKVLRSAQDAANRTRLPYAIYRVRNGQYLYGSLGHCQTQTGYKKSLQRFTVQPQ